ncbi:hypothetical protein NQ314_011588 [Rhamnusium bicolor]|uniref:DDE-1 domain-containing protein n=1 Tax=Rhamnusium bicolor TaxID=1586634 RepID=A0AAV8XI28_9CUCU|nr:hypothetical protein NQ314_011588 [Rhamnusium bicolor]
MSYLSTFVPSSMDLAPPVSGDGDAPPVCPSTEAGLAEKKIKVVQDILIQNGRGCNSSGGVSRVSEGEQQLAYQDGYQQSSKKNHPDSDLPVLHIDDGDLENHSENIVLVEYIDKLEETLKLEAAASINKKKESTSSNLKCQDARLLDTSQRKTPVVPLVVIDDTDDGFVKMAKSTNVKIIKNNNKSSSAPSAKGKGQVNKISKKIVFELLPVSNALEQPSCSNAVLPPPPPSIPEVTPILDQNPMPPPTPDSDSDSEVFSQAENLVSNFCKYYEKQARRHEMNVRACQNDAKITRDAKEMIVHANNTIERARKLLADVERHVPPSPDAPRFSNAPPYPDAPQFPSAPPLPDHNRWYAQHQREMKDHGEPPTLLPCYVVYKAQNLYDSWTIGGPKETRYNRSSSGWFESSSFEDWVEKIAIPYLKKLDGKKFLIGDNLSSHFSSEIVRLCAQHNISFIFLPPNSTHMTQPLDVAFFSPFKGGLEKDTAVLENRKCGICPLNREEVLRRIPTNQEPDGIQENVANSVVAYLKNLRYGDGPTTPRQNKKKKINVLAGKSVTGADFAETSSEDESEHMSLHDSESSFNMEEIENDTQQEDTLIGDEQFTPPGIDKVDPSKKNYIHASMDNFDLNEETIDGRNTTHSMAIVVFQQHNDDRKVISCTDEEIEASFLRSKPSKKTDGQMCSYPEVPDICMVPHDQGMVPHEGGYTHIRPTKPCSPEALDMLLPIEFVESSEDDEAESTNEEGSMSSDEDKWI